MSSTNEQTRAIYHEQHKRIVSDDAAMRRFLGMFSKEYFGLGDDYFVGKRCLDAGCGDTAKLLIRLHQFGASNIVGLDLGESFIPVARQNLIRHGVPEHSFSLYAGSVDALPFDDESFDFVACHGVLLHLDDLDQAERAFDELARVTRPGGHLYVVGGVVGGLFEAAIFPAIRNYYQCNSEFRNLIDNLSPAVINDIFNLIESTFKEQRQPQRIPIERVRELFDVDLCVFFQNVIQAPVRLALDEDFFVKKYRDRGFSPPRRLRRYVTRSNVRQWLAPLHFNLDHPVSKALYGSGNLEFVGRKNGAAR